MTFHPKLHERITTVAALFPGSKLELLVLDEGTAMVECRHGTCYCSVLLDDEGRRALIVALGGLPIDNAELDHGLCGSRYGERTCELDRRHSTWHRAGQVRWPDEDAD